MHLFRKPRTSTPDARLPEIVPIDFDRSRWPGIGLQAGGLLHYFQDGRRGSVRLALTWEALATLQAELRRGGGQTVDDVLVKRVLTKWAIDELKKRAILGQPAPAAGLVLDFGSGPHGQEPRQLLERCGLLLPAVGASLAPRPR